MRCEIIRDLLPLYIDNALSDVSKEEVAKHLKGCQDCNRIYEDMNEGDIKVADYITEIEPMKKVKRKLRITKVLFTAFVSAFILLTIAYELLCANPLLVSSDKISYSVSSYTTDSVYSYFDDINNRRKELLVPKDADFKLDTFENTVYVDGEKLLDDSGAPVPATGTLYPGGSLRVSIYADNPLTAMKRDIDQRYSGDKVSATLGFRPCLPFRQDINELCEENGMVWSAPLANIGEGSTLTIHCRDKDIVLDLYKLSKEAE